MSAVVRSGFSLLALIFFALNVWFLYAVDKLRKGGCQCAESWRRNFIEFMLAVFVILFIAGLVFPVNKYMVGILGLIYFGLVVAYILITRQFIDSLYASHCTCAETDAIWWLGLINIVQIVFLFLGVLFALLGLLFHSRSKGSSSSRRR